MCGYAFVHNKITITALKRYLNFYNFLFMSTTKPKTRAVTHTTSNKCIINMTTVSFLIGPEVELSFG